MSIRKIKASLVKADIDDYYCEYSYLFYDIETGCIRVADNKKGGKPIYIEEVKWGNITGEISSQPELESRLLQHSTKSINSDSVETIMSLTTNYNESIKYILTVTDNTNQKFATSEVLSIYRTQNNSIRFNWYSKLGDYINYRPDIIYNSPNIEFRIENNDENTIEVSVTRIRVIFL